MAKFTIHVLPPCPSNYSEGTKGQNYPFGIMGMTNKADCLQKGELVKFQLCTVAQTGQKMACNVVPQRKALVECVKDQVSDHACQHFC